MNDAVVDRVLVHAVLWLDGRIDGQSVVTLYSSGSFTTAPFHGELAGVRFSNAIAVIGAADMAFPAGCRSIPELIAAIQKEQRPAEANHCHIVTF